MHRTTRRMLAATGGGLALLGSAFAGPPAMAQGGTSTTTAPCEPEIRIGGVDADPTRDIFGNVCVASVEVVVAVDGIEVGRTTAGADGAFSLTLSKEELLDGDWKVLTAVVDGVVVASYVPDAYGGNPGFLLQPDHGRGGVEVELAGQGCGSEQDVRAITVGSTNHEIGGGRSDRSGNFRFPVRIPADLAPGPVTVIATCGDITMSTTFTVDPPAPLPPPLVQPRFTG